MGFGHESIANIADASIWVGTPLHNCKDLLPLSVSDTRPVSAVGAKAPSSHARVSDLSDLSLSGLQNPGSFSLASLAFLVSLIKSLVLDRLMNFI